MLVARGTGVTCAGWLGPVTGVELGLYVSFSGILTFKRSDELRAIAKAITLLESTRADHRAQADELLSALLPHTG